MRILIWKSYGEIEVYTAAELGFFERLQQAVHDIFLGWNEPTTLRSIEGARDVEDIIDAIKPHIGTHETFEEFRLSSFKNHTLREVRE